MRISRTHQIKTWDGDFGRKYTNRNIFLPKDLDRFYIDTWGSSHSQMIKDFLMPIKKNITKALEIGCNVGNQLNSLQRLGFKELYGIDIQSYAVEKAKRITKDINIIKGSAFDVPFKGNYFDLVFTAGVLIHISPNDIGKALDEIHRCSKRYIFGFEYFSEDYAKIKYRGKNNLLWKTDFCKLYLNRFSDLKIVKERKYKYIKSNKMDTMFLLEKKKYITNRAI